MATQKMLDVDDLVIIRETEKAVLLDVGSLPGLGIKKVYAWFPKSGVTVTKGGKKVMQIGERYLQRWKNVHLGPLDPIRVS